MLEISNNSAKRKLKADYRDVDFEPSVKRGQTHDEYFSSKYSPSENSQSEDSRSSFDGCLKPKFNIISRKESLLPKDFSSLEKKCAVSTPFNSSQGSQPRKVILISKSGNIPPKTTPSSDDSSSDVKKNSLQTSSHRNNFSPIDGIRSVTPATGDSNALRSSATKVIIIHKPNHITPLGGGNTISNNNSTPSSQTTSLTQCHAPQMKKEFGGLHFTTPLNNGERILNLPRAVISTSATCSSRSTASSPDLFAAMATGNSDCDLQFSGNDSQPNFKLQPMRERADQKFKKRSSTNQYQNNTLDWSQDTQSSCEARTDFCNGMQYKNEAEEEEESKEHQKDGDESEVALEIKKERMTTSQQQQFPISSPEIKPRFDASDGGASDDEDGDDDEEDFSEKTGQDIKKKMPKPFVKELEKVNIFIDNFMVYNFPADAPVILIKDLLLETNYLKGPENFIFTYDTVQLEESSTLRATYDRLNFDEAEDLTEYLDIIIRLEKIGDIYVSFTSGNFKPSIGEENPTPKDMMEEEAADISAPTSTDISPILEKTKKGRKKVNSDNVEENPIKTKKIQLWQFILVTLLEGKHDDKIAWIDGERSFILKKKDEFAKLWALTRGKDEMRYNHLSRSIRNYYKQNIMAKGSGKSFTYKFEDNATINTGFTIVEMRRLYDPSLSIDPNSPEYKQFEDLKRILSAPIAVPKTDDKDSDNKQVDHSGDEDCDE